MTEILKTFLVDRKSKTPIYQQIGNFLKEHIKSEKLPEGTKLPSELQLKQLWGINHLTIRKSLANLEEEGFIERKQRVGTTVLSKASWQKPTEDRVGYIIWRNKSTYVPNILDNNYLEDINDELIEREIPLIILGSQNDWKDLNDIIQQEKITGIIASATMNEEHHQILANCVVPSILLEIKSRNQKIDSFYIDSYQGVYDGTTHLIQHGHRDIAYIGGKVFDSRVNPAPLTTIPLDKQLHRLAQDSFDRYNAIRRAFEDLFIHFNTDRYYEVAIDEVTVEKLTKDIMKKKPHPTAIIAFDDQVAEDIIQTLEKLGYSVPDDVSVLGFGELSPLSKTGQLASVSLDIKTLAKLAIDRLLERKNHKIMSGLHYPINSTFKPGKSIGRVPMKVKS